jgi:hypothetical protein
MASLGSGFTNPMSDLKGYADGARESIQRVLQEEGDDVIDTSSVGPPPEQNNNWNEMYQGARDEDVEPVQPREHGTIDQPSHQPNAGQKIQINQTHEREHPISTGSPAISAHVSMKRALMDQDDHGPDFDHTSLDEGHPGLSLNDSITGL